MSHRSTAVGGSSGSTGCRTRGRTGSPCPPGVLTSTHEWPYHVIARVPIESHVDTSLPLGLHPRPHGRAGPRRAVGYTRPRAGAADRREPRVHQLDRADRPRDRVVRGGRRSAARAPRRTRGYLAFTAPAAAALRGPRVPLGRGPAGDASAGSPLVADPAFDAPRRIALGAFMVILAVAYTVALCARSRAPWLAVAGLVAGLAASSCSRALAWGGGALGAVPLLLQLVVLDVATGGVFAAMILGHWYLVTPKLRRGAAVLIAPAALDRRASSWCCSWPGSRPAPDRPGGSPFERPCRASGRCSSGCGCCRARVPADRVVGGGEDRAMTRSMESATGLLYINVGADRGRARSWRRACTSAPGCSCDGPADERPPR